MREQGDLLTVIRRSAARCILFLPHAVRQMSRPDRMISTGEVRAVIEQGEIIEDYPEDARGHSALMRGVGDGGRIIHIVCSPKTEFAAVITAYLPDPNEWSVDLRERKPK